MANGLTDSDLNRQRLGFGVSPDTASRRRAVESGVAPLTTGERIRRDWGWGPSTPEEQKAFQAAEVIERGGPVEQMPVEYGGRPTGTSRRALRMQAEYDVARSGLLDQQRAMQQAETEQRRITLQERQEARLEAAEAKAQDEALKISDQADFALNEVLGGFDPAGNPISGLDPDAPDYMQRRNDIIKRYPKALRDAAFKDAIATTDKSYFDTENFNQQLQVQQQTEERMLGKEQRMEERQREARKEDRGEQKESLIVSQEREIQRKIREQNEKLRETNAALAGRKSLSEKQKADLDAIKNGITDLRIEKADLRGLAFETEEEANAANPPSGSTIYIGRKPFKVP